MKYYILSDLHIAATDDVSNTAWIEHFSNFLQNSNDREAWIFVLGDIINRGDPMAYESAGYLFDELIRRLSGVDYHFVFLPGNHDYCSGSLDAYTAFTKKYQDNSIPYFDFSVNHVWNFTLNDSNFIFADSVNGGRYDMPGRLDLAGLERCYSSSKNNILLLHHSLIFEDGFDHTGVTMYPDTLAFIKRHGIKYVFHSHAHTTRFDLLSDDVNTFGVGAIKTGMSGGHTNENEQFFEIQINGFYIEAVANWLWRGGMNCYHDHNIYPLESTSPTTTLVSKKDYPIPPEYIKRYVLPFDEEEFHNHHNISDWTTLTTECLRHSRVLLISEAGMGKSFELQNLSNELSAYKEIYPVLLHLNTYNAQTIQSYIDVYATDYRTLNPNRLYLIFDGFDELASPDVFIRELTQYLFRNKGVRVCISMRSNFLHRYLTFFKEYKKFDLLGLDTTAISSLVDNRGIDPQSFFAETISKGLHGFRDNPFYLCRMIEIYLRDGQLPTQATLMQRLVDTLMNEDAKKFEYTSLNLRELQYNTEIALTRFAFAVQLWKCSTLNDLEFQRLLTPEDRELLKYSGMTVHEPEGHTFSHKIFAEYFSAKWIAQLTVAEIIERISIPGTQDINPSWFNIVGFVLQMNSDVELIKWIFESDPLVLTKMELSSVTDTLRVSVLTAVITWISQNNTWFRDEICTLKQLASFCQCKESLELLLRHIQNPKHSWLLYFCLDLIDEFSSLFCMDDSVRTVLVECYRSEKTRTYEKRMAIRVIADLLLNTPEITEDLIRLFSQSKNSNERLGVYEYLKITNQLDDHVDFLVDGIQYICYSHRDDEFSNGIESYTLIDCLCGISHPAAIAKAISWFGDHENRSQHFYDYDRVLTSLFKKATDAYNNGNVFLFDCVFNFYRIGIFDFSRNNHPISFFKETNTIKEAFLKLLPLGDEIFGWMLDDLISEDSSLMTLFCDMFSNDQLEDPQIFLDFAQRTKNKKYYEQCNQTILEKMGKALPVFTPRVDYVTLERQEEQAFFDSLFDRQEMQKLLGKLVLTYEKPGLTFDQLREDHNWQREYPVGVKTLVQLLHAYNWGDIPVADFFNHIDWDFFFMKTVNSFLNSRGENLTISAAQREVLLKKADVLFALIDYHTAIHEDGSHSYTCQCELLWYLQLVSALQIDPPVEYYLGILEIPHYFVPAVRTESEKFKLIEAHIPEQQIKEKIEALMKDETRDSILSELFAGCTRYSISGFSENAVQFCLNSDGSLSDRKNALEYLLATNTKEQVWERVAPYADADLFYELLSMLQPLRELSFSTAVKSELLSRLQQDYSDEILKELIAMNAKEGVELYIRKCSSQNSIPDKRSKGVESLTEAMGQITDITLLPLLTDAVRVLCQDNFKDGSFHTLYGSLQKAFSAIAKEDYEAVFGAITNIRNELSDNLRVINFCSNLVEDISRSHRMTLIPQMSIIDIHRYIYQIS